MLRRKHPTISVLANLLRLAESRSIRESQRDSVPEPKGCAAVAPKRRYGAPRRRKARATLGHRPTNIPNRNAVEAHPFPPARLTSATTPLALIRFPNAHPR